MEQLKNKITMIMTWDYSITNCHLKVEPRFESDTTPCMHPPGDITQPLQLNFQWLYIYIYIYIFLGYVNFGCVLNNFSIVKWDQT